MSLPVRVVRQFHEAADTIMLEKVIMLPDVPTMGTRLDLRAEGVEDPLVVVGLMMRPIADGPGVNPPSVTVWLIPEPFAAAEHARSSGWTDYAPVGSDPS